ncbi:MAG: hypothetical protein LUC93_13785 [Planctomycetaceae bacterium]|nr:hypothetical protein [Planctomycetaceae bacterium]
MIMVEGNRVEFRVRAGFGPLLGGFFLFATSLVALLATLPFHRFGSGYAMGGIILEVLILLWTGDMFFRAVVGFSQKTIVDNDAKVIRHADLFGEKQPIPFADVGAIDRVSRGVDANASVAYKITRRGHRFGKGWALTRPQPPDNDDRKHLETTILPILLEAIRSESPESEAPDSHVHYREIDGGYERRTAPSFILVAVVCFAILMASPFKPWALVFITLAMYAVFQQLQTSRIRIEPEAGTVTLKPAALRKRVSIRLEDVIAVEETYRFSILEPVRIGIRYRVDDATEVCPFCTSYRRRLAESVALETEALLRGNIRHEDPS